MGPYGIIIIVNDTVSSFKRQFRGWTHKKLATAIGYYHTTNNPVKTFEQCFPMASGHYAVPQGSVPVDSENKTLKCNNFNESFTAVIPCGTVYYTIE